MFVGREKELQALDRAYHTKGFQMAVIYGRRRVGKSTMIREFVKGKKAVFYTCTKTGERNAEYFASEVMRVLDPGLSEVSFRDLSSVLRYITEKLNEEKLVIIIDELPYWAEKDEAMLSVLQKFIDEYWLEREIMLVVCGSALSFMEDKVLSEKSPLFGRRTMQIRLSPFTFRESEQFTPDYTAEEKALVYGITGGIAKYLDLIDPCLSSDENIIRLFFDRDGYLYGEPGNLLIQEFNDVAIVNRIIEQLAAGENTLSTIADKCHEQEATVLYHLNRLCTIGLAEKKHCICEEKNRKKSMYVLKDTMFRFWYMFIPKASSVIEMGYGREYYLRYVKPKLHSYMGSIFEDMCRYWIFEQSLKGNMDIFLTKTGTWWGTRVTVKERKKTIEQTDIDVVGLSDIDRCYVVGECKFKNEPVNTSVYETLVQRASLVPTEYELKKKFLFSLSGFSEGVKELNDPDLMTVSLDDMYR